MSVLAQVRDLFVEPAPSAESARRAEQARGAEPVPHAEFPLDSEWPAEARTAPPISGSAVWLPTVAVLGAPAQARAVAAGVALGLARRHRCAIGLVATLGARPVPAGPATLAAGRVASRLRRGGVEAVAAGRLVWLVNADLDATLSDVVVEAAAPAAIAVCADRCDAVDALLAGCDGLVVASRPDAAPALAPLVLGSLEALGRPVVAIEPLARAAAALATAGVRAPASVTAALVDLDAASARR